MVFICVTEVTRDAEAVWLWTLVETFYLKSTMWGIRNKAEYIPSSATVTILIIFISCSVFHE